jgi:hypothetical protein
MFQDILNNSFDRIVVLTYLILIPFRTPELNGQRLSRDLNVDLLKATLFAISL